MWTLIWAFAIGIAFRLGWGFGTYVCEYIEDASAALVQGFKDGYNRRRNT